MTSLTIDETIKKYENFINNVLREDLRVLQERLIQTNIELTDFRQQRLALKLLMDKKMFPEKFKAQVNIGCNFFMDATVTDTSKMLVHIGLDHYLEFTPTETDKYFETLIKAYEEKSEEIRTKAFETQAHIKMMLMGLNELVNETETGSDVKK